MFKQVILIGNGCRGNPILIDYLGSLGIPILLTWMARDMYDELHPSFCGVPGTIGQRAANIIVQKADALFIFGARMDAGTVCHNIAGFAPNAVKHIWDVDVAELTKFFGLPLWNIHNMDLSVDNPDLKDLRNGDPAWLEWCKNLYARFRPELDGPHHGLKETVDPFDFMRVLSNNAKETDIFAIGSSGQAAEVFYQAFKVKKGQRIVNLSTLGPMGADIPMAVGACLASGLRRTICVTGDGGFMLNTQELEVIRRLNLPIIFFVFCNDGYGSIRTMQNMRFEGRHVGCDPASGFTIPDINQIAKLYNTHIKSIPIAPGWKHYPKVVSNAALQPDPMEKMTPYISDVELKNIMEWGA